MGSTPVKCLKVDTYALLCVCELSERGLGVWKMSEMPDTLDVTAKCYEKLNFVLLTQ